MNEKKVDTSIPDEYKPLSTNAYIGYNALFLIPIVGFIFLIIFSFDKKNISRRNYAQAFWGTANLIILIIIGLIYLQIEIFYTKRFTNIEYDYSKFAQQFGEYSDQVIMDGATAESQLKENGIDINKAQKFYIAANGLSEDYEVGSGEIFETSLPVGYVIPDVIKKALNIEDGQQVVAYLISDNQITGYETKENLDFYGDQNGREYHLVTSDGTVFTIPGFKEKQEDGSSKFYITAQGHYYTVIGSSDKMESKENKILVTPVIIEDFE